MFKTAQLYGELIAWLNESAVATTIVFVGLRDDDLDAQFSWIDECDDAALLNRWRPAEPSNPNQDCTAMMFQNCPQSCTRTSGVLADIFCTDTTGAASFCVNEPSVDQCLLFS